MKILMLLILISLSALRVFSQTTNPSPTLLEAQKLSAEVVKLFQQKKYDDALPLAQKAISIRENELGKNHISVAQAWRNLAYIQLQREKQKEAEKAFEMLLKFTRKINRFRLTTKKHLPNCSKPSPFTKQETATLRERKKVSARRRIT